MKKRLGLCIIVAIVAVLVAIFAPWDRLTSIKDKLLGVGDSYASLKIYSLGGDMKVYVDNEEKGIVREHDSYLEIFPIAIGEHEIKLVREATVEGFYKDFVRLINFEKGFDVVISWEIGPTDMSSSGWILYAQQSSEKQGMTLVNLICYPSDCKIEIEGGEEYTAPMSRVELNLDKPYTFKAQADGYQDLEFQVLGEDDEARRRLEGYELFFEVNLYKIPI